MTGPRPKYSASRLRSTPAWVKAMRQLKLPRAGGQKWWLETDRPWVSMERSEGTTTVLRLR